MTFSKTAGAASAILAAAALGACGKPASAPEKAAVDTAKIAAAVKADADQLVAEFDAHDAVKAVAHDAPDVVSMFHGVPNTVGPAADLATTKQQLSDAAAKVEVSDETVDVASAGDMAVYHSTYAYTLTDPKTKKPTTEHGNWLIGYKAQPDRTWKITWDVVSDTGPAPAPAAAH